MGERHQNDVSAQIQRVNLQNVASTTRATYGRYQKRLAAWLEDNYPDVLINGNVDVDKITTVHFQEFLVTLRTKEGSQPGYQTLNGYRAALNSLFRDSNK